MNWLYNEGTIEDISQFPENTYGFVYRVTHTPTGKSYIGKKVLYHNKKVKLGKKELALHEGVGRKPSSKIVTSESDWKKYWGSNKPLLELKKTEPIENFEREILLLCPSKKLLTYYETRTLFIYRVLETPDIYFNTNILGKFFTTDFN